jgi:tRNA-splicing endonuclease subunit Sen54
MADLDEDPPIGPGTVIDDDQESGDETQDFLRLASLTSKSTQLPKRGEKDFEPHGTKHQDGILAASRKAMHEVLDYTRVHTPKAHVRAFYYGVDSLERDKVINEEWRRGLEDDHVVLLESSKGVHFKTMGKDTLGKKRSSLWLLPEEALYLVERGTLDLWWPSRSSFKGHIDVEGKDASELDQDQTEKDEGLPMSLQAAYAMLLGDDSEKGKISFDRYAVYNNLRRAGYVVMRHSDSKQTTNSTALHANGTQESSSIFTWLWGRLFAEDEVKHPAFGPLVKPGMYRTYNSIYRQIAIIPRYKPTQIPQSPSHPPEAPYLIVYNLWKATRIAAFSKSNPGIPDVRLAITDARSSSIPTLKQMTSLLESTPWDPPPQKGPTQTFQRLKHGYRNVILAVVDQGIISYLRLSEAAFGEEHLYERFDRGSGRVAKRGGMSRGKGSGRGRGRGRGK